ncbi:single-stranded-DNA-specific exonuclease RecJ, partial [Patescibacteria group bacterium]|nr:single-stranded-DNA-specific exonuclease RecJ [Patescibacteria group bacterium]
IEEFLNPDYEKHLHDPYLMKDMEKAAARILDALSREEKILIYGDYDADGVTATALLMKTLIFLGGKEKNLSVYIPDRSREGYGLNEAAVKKFSEEKINLIITVDCGVANAKEVKLAEGLGIETIISDHHYISHEVPKAYAVINPRQKNDNYPFKELAGAGIAYKLCSALLAQQNPVPSTRDSGLGGLEKNSSQTDPPAPMLRRAGEKKENFQKWLLDLVALGTIADCVSLKGENRTLAKYGLMVLGKTRRPGLKALIKNSRINDDSLITAREVSFQIVPRLNAAGRMDHANSAYELLITEDPKEAAELSRKLEKRNQERQSATEKIISEVKVRLSAKRLEKIILEGSAEWPIGLLGLVAGKISEEHNRPALIYHQGKTKCVGSGRSNASFNLIKALMSAEPHLLEFGGHARAAGFSAIMDKIPAFYETLLKRAETEIIADKLIPTIEIDAEINSEEVNIETLRLLNSFAPFGEDNEPPVFLLKNLSVSKLRLVGNGNKHLKLILKDGRNKTTLGAIAFNLARSFTPPSGGINIGKTVDVAAEIIPDDWNGNNAVGLKIIDIKLK